MSGSDEFEKPQTDREPEKLNRIRQRDTENRRKKHVKKEAQRQRDKERNKNRAATDGLK